MCGAVNIRRKPVRDPHAGPRRGPRLRQARAAWPIRNSTGSATRTHACHVAASPGLSALEQDGMIRKKVYFNPGQSLSQNLIKEISLLLVVQRNIIRNHPYLS